MPELPDITVYVECLRPRVVGKTLINAMIKSPFLVRSVEPPIQTIDGKRVLQVDRLGKRIVLGLESDLFLILHLYIAGRLLWKAVGATPSGRIDLAALQFETGTLILTEAGTTRRASLHVVLGRGALAEHDRGGLDPLRASAHEFESALRAENHTVKRSLTDPRLFSGIGNAYSDEILHAAQLSPLKLTKSLTPAEVERLHAATVKTLNHWIGQLREEFGLQDGLGRFPGPGQITAFRDGFAVHGRFGKPCPVCGLPVQRIVHAENETNYCAGCQTGGRVLADRSMSRLLKDDWPRNIEDL